MGTSGAHRTGTAAAFVFFIAVAVRSAPLSDVQAEAAARRFCETIVRYGGFSYDEFIGATRERMRPLVSKRLLKAVDDVRNCGRDWLRHQPADSTDKPPFVDCCVFSDSADWSPTSFKIVESKSLRDSRQRVIVEYRYDSATERGRWRVALYVAQEQRHFVVDDFEGGLDDPSQHWFASAGMPECKSGKWKLAY